jgi:hypothetical protein
MFRGNELCFVPLKSYYHFNRCVYYTKGEEWEGSFIKEILAEKLKNEKTNSL